MSKWSCFYFYNALLATHDHVWPLLSKRTSLFFYYVFLTSHEHAITFLSKRSSQLLFVMLCYLTTSMHERSCPRSSVYIIFFYYVLPTSHDHCMNIIIKDNQLIFLLCSSIYLRPRMHVIGQVLQSMFFHYVLPASHNHVWMHYSGGSVSFFYCASS